MEGSLLALTKSIHYLMATVVNHESKKLTRTKLQLSLINFRVPHVFTHKINAPVKQLEFFSQKNDNDKPILRQKM